MILQKYIFLSLLRPFFIGFGFVSMLLTMDLLLDLLDMLLNRGIGIATVGQIFLFALGWISALTVPCGMLVAVLMTYGRMSQDNEITALRASGVHLFRVVAPALVMAVILAVGLAAFNNYVLPKTNYAYAKLIRQITRKNPTVQIREGVINDDFKGYSIRINQLDDRSGRMEDIVILDSRVDPRAPRTILARSGSLSYHPDQSLLLLDLEDGTVHETDPASDEGEYRVVSFESQRLQIQDPIDTWDSDRSHNLSDREMSIPAMLTKIEELKVEQAREREKIRDGLETLGMSTVEELARFEPSSVPPRGRDRLFGDIKKWFRRGEVEPKRSWTRQEENAIGVVRSRYRDVTELQKNIEKYRVEIHKKFSIPFACIVFVIVGAPLGMVARRGGAAVALFSVIFFIFYYLCLMGGEQLADRLLVPTWVAMWFPNVLLGLLGVWLFRKALRSGTTSPVRVRGSSPGAA